MADGSDLERTEDPTPKRRQESADEGKIPRSAELTTAAVLLASALALGTLAPAAGAQLMAVMGQGLAALPQTLDQASSVMLLRTTAWNGLLAMAPMLGAITAVALSIAALQARGTLTAKPLAPKWERISPGSNLKRVFGWQSLAELLKSLLKMGIIGMAVWWALSAAWGEIVGLAQVSPAGMLAVVKSYAVRILMTAGIAYVALAVLDYAFQLWQHEKGMKMTKEEVKQEMRQSEGDPMVKQRLRSFGRALARRQMFSEVPKADVVITNPTHIAIALLYDPDVSPAPIVLAMGQRKVAQRIKQIAFENGVPVVENKPLARALFAMARVGTAIPAEFYRAVAEVLAFVLRQRAMAPGRWRGAHA